MVQKTQKNVKTLLALNEDLLPTGWRVIPLSELLAFGPKNGFSPPAVEFETQVRALTLSATTSGKFKGTYFKYVDIDPPAVESELWIKPGDILIQRANAIQYVGVSVIYEGESNEYIYPDLMIKIRVCDSIYPHFAVLALNSSSVRQYFRSHASGTSGSMPKINHRTLLNAPITLPPKPEQKRIIETMWNIDAQSAAIKSEMKLINLLKIQISDAITLSAIR